MNKILAFLASVLGLLLFGATKRNEKLKEQNRKQKQQTEEKEFIANEQTKAQVNQKHIDDRSDDDIKRLYHNNKWLD